MMAVALSQQNIIDPNKMKRKVPRQPAQLQSTSCKRMRFSEFSSLVVIEPRSSEDIEHAWYTKKEMTQFKRNALQASQALRETRIAKVMKHIARSAATGTPRSNIHAHQSKEIIRGIEHMISPQVWRLLMDKRRKTVARVLEEQQASRGNSSSIAGVSQINSSFSKEWCSRITQFQQT